MKFAGVPYKVVTVTVDSDNEKDRELGETIELVGIESSDGCIITQLYDWKCDGSNKVYAEHIVKCVNSHDALVESLKMAIKSMLVSKRRLENELLSISFEDRAQSNINFSIGIIEAEINAIEQALKAAGETL